MTTWGEPNEARDNAILITTWYSGTHQIWREVYVGSDYTLNPERYFIVAINQIGSCLSTKSASPTRSRSARASPRARAA